MRSFGPYFVRNAELGAEAESNKSRTLDNPTRIASPLGRPRLDRVPKERGASRPGGGLSAIGGSFAKEAAGPARYGRGAYRSSGRADLPPSPLVFSAAGKGTVAERGKRPNDSDFRPGKTATIAPSESGFAREATRSLADAPRDPRVYYYGFHTDTPNGWSFFYRYCQPLPVINFAWSCGYDPLFSLYYWYPYFCHGGIYYYYDYPFYCSPDNPLYVYDVTYPESVDLFPDEEYETRAYVSLSPDGDERPESVTDYFLRLGDQFFRAGEYEKAVDAFRKAVDTDPASAVSHFALGEALFAVADFAYASYALRKGFDLEPSWTENPVDRRDFYGQRADFDSQMSRLLAHCAESPFDAAAFLVLGYNRYFTGETEPAHEAFLRVLELNGADRFAEAFLDRLEIAGSPTAPRVENG